jgi:hypothetical protein
MPFSKFSHSPTTNKQAELTRCPNRFPPPSTIEELDACFIVIDANGQKLASGSNTEKSGRQVPP